MASGGNYAGPEAALAPLLAPSPEVAAEPTKRFDTLWTIYIGLVVLNVFDLITTNLVLNRGGSEGNPFVKPIVDNLWHVGLLKGAVLLLIAALLTRVRGSRLSELALAGTTGWYLAVVCWNVAVLTIL